MTYTALWYDGVGRPIASADYGRDAADDADDGSFTRPTTLPASSDTVLVSTVEYDAASGQAYKFVDPKGIEARLTFDHGGRVTKAIEAYDDGDL